MCVLWTVLFLAVPSPLPVEQPGGEVVFATDFEQDADADYDLWPDGWTRQRGHGFPRYLNIGIVADPPGTENHCLQVQLDGGAAALHSAPIPIDPAYSFLLRGRIKTQQLKHDVVYLSVSLLDAAQQVKETHNSPEWTLAPDWQDVTIGPLTAGSLDVRYAVIGLHVMPTERADLQGAAMFDDIALAQLPRMSLGSRQAQNVFYDPAQVEITCDVSGIPHPAPQLRLELLDVEGRCVDSATLSAEQAAPGDFGHLALGESGAEQPGDDPGPTSFVGALTWRPHVPGCGFFTLRASWPPDGPPALTREASLLVLRPMAKRDRTAFGWSLRPGKLPLDSTALMTLLQQARVGWLRIPLWSHGEDPEALAELSALADCLNSNGIELVGALDTVPAEVQKQVGRQQDMRLAELFERPELWQPALDPLLSRWSLKIRHWQVGSDAITRPSDLDKLASALQDVRQRLKESGYVVRLGLPWGWMYDVPASADPPWDYLVASESIPFTETELERYGASGTGRPDHRWVSLQPLPRAEYEVDVRARDLVLRMLAAKAHGAPVILIHDPFDADRGLLRADGTPGELLLPWRTTADLVGSATLLGSICLPNGSRNWLFERNHEMILVVWNQTQTVETLYLGDEVKQTNVWGEECAIAATEIDGARVQTVTAGPLPVFLTGLHPAIARWRVECTLEPNELSGAFGALQITRLHCRNTFAANVSGSVAVQVPATWEVKGDTAHFELADGSPWDCELPLLVSAESDSGVQRVRIDFTVATDRSYRFSVYRDLQVGLGDAALKLDCWLNDAGQLVVEQQLVNTTERPVNFNCYLYAPGRRRMRQQMLDLPPGRATRTFTLPDGAALLGKTLWLRAEEIGGTRMLNARLVVTP